MAKRRAKPARVRGVRGVGRTKRVPAAAERVTIRYVESSALVAALLEQDAAVRALQVFARRCDIVSVTDAVLIRVGRPFPVEPIRTLDAVHLATAELLDDAPQLVTIVTRDQRVRENARALGYSVE